MNDPLTLQYYAKLLVFKDDPNRKVLIFDPPLSKATRRVLHSLSYHLGLHHVAVSTIESCHIQISKEMPTTTNAVDLPFPSYSNIDASRKSLNQDATIDFSDVRVRETGLYRTIRRQAPNLLDVPGSPGLGIQRGRSLHEAKSFSDLQSRRALPALSSSRFPANEIDLKVSGIDSWSLKCNGNSKTRLWRCGFCGRLGLDWDQRLQHISEHWGAGIKFRRERSWNVELSNLDDLRGNFFSEVVVRTRDPPLDENSLLDAFGILQAAVNYRIACKMREQWKR
jgi:hypothetical protein